MKTLKIDPNLPMARFEKRPPIECDSKVALKKCVADADPRFGT